MDLDLLDFLVGDAGGEPGAHPGHVDSHKQWRKRRLRILAAMSRGSAERARASVAGRHARVCDSRGEFLDKSSTDLVRHCEGRAVGDLAVPKMVQNQRLAKAIDRTA